MSEPQRRQVRVRRSPKIGVFLVLGAVIGALVAVVLVNAVPSDGTIPTTQAVGFVLILLVPLGALVGGVLALVLDRISERRARTVDAERIPPVEPAEVPSPADAQDPAPVAPADEDRG